MTKDRLDESEFRYHEQWLKDIYASDCHIGFFEHNLEVWRQFWRVCEVSDVIVVVLDIRFPLLHYPLSLHRYLETLKKPIICTLMKCDLVDPKLVEFWKTSMRSYFGETLLLVETSVYDMVDTTISVKNPRRYRDSLGVQELLDLCKLAVNNKNDTEWDMISRQKTSGTKLDESMPATETSYITIGMLGHPNVGKSSLINSIVGRKVVSASKTPGHTKHFQTIHLTKNIRLCDCPGLIFPVSLSRELQILNGLFNVAQLRDPFGPILAATMLINVPKSLGLTLPPEEREWSVLLISESFAIQKGFFTSKAGRPDVHRAANLLLRMILDGRVLIAWHPDSYSGLIARTLVYRDGTDSESETQESSASSNDDRILQANRFLSLVDE
jgi:ribosome biogenesis GTPase A